MGLADDFDDTMQLALRAAAEQVLTLAKQYAPVGDPELDPNPSVSLAESGRIRPDGKGFIIEFTAPYAAKQHEDLRLKHPRGGGAKYLERALTEITPTLDRIVASKVHARTATGLTSDPSRSHHKGRQA